MDQPKKYGIDEVFSLIGEEYLTLKRVNRKCNKNIEVDGNLVHPVSLRYMCFYQHGTTCACCGKKGSYFLLIGEENSTRKHFDLFADDGTLMTKDHIVPLFYGGRNHVDNLQTMCEDCNKKKGHSLYGDTQKRICAVNEATGETREFKTIKEAARFAVCNKITPSGKKKMDCVNAGINAVLGIQMAVKYGSPFCNMIWSEKEANE